MTAPRPTQGGKGPAALAALSTQKRKRTDGESSDDSKTSDEEAENEQSLARRKAKQRKQLEGECLCIHVSNPCLLDSYRYRRGGAGASLTQSG